MSTPALFASIPQPLVVFRPVRDRDGTVADFVYESVNAAAADFYGRSSSDLVGSRMLELHPNMADTELFRAYCHIAAGGEPLVVQDLEYEQDLLGGQLRYYDVRAMEVGGCVSAMWIDVTERHRALEALARSEEWARKKQAEIQSIFDSQIDPFVRFENVFDESGRIVDLRFAEANPAAAAYNNLTLDQMIGMTFLELFPNLMKHGPMAEYLQCATDGTPVVLDDYFYPNEVLGSERRYDIRAVQCEGGMALTWRDVTERYRAIEEIIASEQRYRLLADNTSDVVWQVDPEGRVAWASESTHAILGWLVDDVLGTVAADYLHPDDLSRALESRNRVLEGSEIRQRFRVRRGDSSFVWMAFVVRPLPSADGATSRVVAMHDVTAEVAARDQLEEVIGRDPLTGLMTRDAMQAAIARAGEHDGGCVTLLCVGPDSLSTINDAFGHAAGDIVLAATAARLVLEAGDVDAVGRGAGVDFLVLLADRDGATNAAELAERIRRSAKEAIDLGRHVVTPTVSIGIASMSGDGDPSELIRSATLAMRAAKDAGRDCLAYASSEQAALAEQKVTIVAAAADALRAGQIVAWFQPVHDLRTHERVGYEALARWLTADGSVREPAAFLPLIETLPLIVELDSAVLRQSIHLLAEIPAAQFVSVNASSRALSTPDYVDGLIAILDDSGVDPARLHLEVTETDLLDVSGSVVAGMRRIAATGVQWYVDDFGTGYSSISHLRDLPIRGLKLDLTFTAGITVGDERSIRLAQALAGLATGLGLDTIAEGIETQQQAAVLSSQGWRLGQGWLYGRATAL